MRCVPEAAQAAAQEAPHLQMVAQAALSAHRHQAAESCMRIAQAAAAAPQAETAVRESLTISSTGSWRPAAGVARMRQGRPLVQAATGFTVRAAAAAHIGEVPGQTVPEPADKEVMGAGEPRTAAAAVVAVKEAKAVTWWIS